MTDINILQERLDRAKAALREAKKRAKNHEDQQILSAVRRSGLTLVDLESLLAKDRGCDVVDDQPFVLER